jgi:hypothetical protein
MRTADPNWNPVLCRKLAKDHHPHTTDWLDIVEWFDHEYELMYDAI